MSARIDTLKTEVRRAAETYMQRVDEYLDGTCSRRALRYASVMLSTARGNLVLEIERIEEARALGRTTDDGPEAA